MFTLHSHQNLDHTHRGIKNISNMSLILIQNKTNTNKPNISTLYKIIYHMKKLTYNPIENPSTNVHKNQQSIYDINTQCKELDKRMLIANTLKGNLNSQQSTNSSWIVTTREHSR